MMTRDSEAAVDNLVNVAAVSNNPGNVALGEHGLAGHSLPLLFEKLYIARILSLSDCFLGFLI